MERRMEKNDYLYEKLGCCGEMASQDGRATISSLLSSSSSSSSLLLSSWKCNRGMPRFMCLKLIKIKRQNDLYDDIQLDVLKLFQRKTHILRYYIKWISSKLILFTVVVIGVVVFSCFFFSSSTPSYPILQFRFFFCFPFFRKRSKNRTTTRTSQAHMNGNKCVLFWSKLALNTIASQVHLHLHLTCT